MFGLGIRNLDFGHLFPAKLEEIKWRTEIRPFKTQKPLKSGLLEGQISNGWALAMALAIVPTIQNPDIFAEISNRL